MRPRRTSTKKGRQSERHFPLSLLFYFLLFFRKRVVFIFRPQCLHLSYTKRLHIQNTRGSRAIISFISLFAPPLPSAFPLSLLSLPFLLSRLGLLLSANLQRRCPRRPVRSDPLLLAIVHFQEASSLTRPATFASCSLARYGSTAFAVLGKYSERNRGIRRDRVSSPSIVLESRASASKDAGEIVLASLPTACSSSTTSTWNFR